MASFSNTQRGYATCPQRWLLRYGLGLKPAKRARVLSLGSFLHEGLEALYAAQAEGRPFAEHAILVMDAITAVRDKEIRRINALPSSILDPATYVSGEQVGEMREAARTAETLVLGYIQHWQNDPWRLVGNELHLNAKVRNCNGNKSTATDYQGILDKLVEYNGHTLIVEHKSTSLQLAEWFEKSRRSAQARSYAWLAKEHGIKVHGVIYDLVQSKPPRAWNELPVLKDGTRLSKNVTPWTTAANFLQAITALHPANSPGDPLDDVDWYRATHEFLVEREKDGFWYKREVELFTDSEIARVEAELYEAGTRIRRWADETSEFREWVKSSSDNVEAAERIESSLHKIGTDFPRESSQCWRYNRLCEFAAVCESWSRYDVEQGFEIAGMDYDEDPEDTNEG